MKVGQLNNRWWSKSWFFIKIPTTIVYFTPSFKALMADESKRGFVELFLLTLFLG